MNTLSTPRHGSHPQKALVGLWLVRVPGEDGEGPMLARVQDELYALAFTTAPRASSAATALGFTGRPFYVLEVNHDAQVRDLKTAGAAAFIVDYDAARATFAAALPLPQLDWLQ